MMTYEIEKNVAMPMPSTPSPAEKPPVHRMDIGDSIVVKAKGGMGATNKVQNTARFSGLPYKFRSAKVSDGVYRVWRIA